MVRASSVLFSTAVFLCLSVGGARAEQDSAAAYEIKAAFLYNFALHVEWPSAAFEGSNSPIVIGVLGEDPFKGFLDRAVKEKTAQGRSLKVEHPGRMEDLKKVHILFIPGAEKQQIGKAVESLKEAPTLVVGESPGLLREGAVMNFFIEESRVRFEINLEAARKRNLKIGAKLQKIARVVQDS